MLSVGHQLMKARQLRGLSIEDVAFETRIPHLRLRDMENDDLSNFANLTYAKGFLKLYSRYLKLDLSDYLDEFDTSMISAVTGHEYVHTANTVRLLSAPAFASDDGQRSRIAANLLGIAALTAVLIGGGWFVYKSQLNQTASASPAPTNRPGVTVATASAETFPTPVETSNTLRGPIPVPSEPRQSAKPRRHPKQLLSLPIMCARPRPWMMRVTKLESRDPSECEVITFKYKNLPARESHTSGKVFPKTPARGCCIRWGSAIKPANPHQSQPQNSPIFKT